MAEVYVEFTELGWNERWQVQTDLTPADWLKDELQEAWREHRSVPVDGLPARIQVGRGWDAYLALPNESMKPDRHLSGWGFEYLTDEVSMAFASVFRRHSTDPETCWAATWEGFGDSAAFTDSYAHKIDFPLEHGHILSRGSLSHVENGGDPEGIWPEFLRSPNYWWPSGKEWLVVSEIDTAATYVGCSKDCSAELLSLGIQGLEPISGETLAIPDF